MTRTGAPKPRCLACGIEITATESRYSFIHIAPSVRIGGNRTRQQVETLCKAHGQQALSAMRVWFASNRLEQLPDMGDKYAGVRIQGIDFHSGEPVFIIRGQDRTANAAITAYLQLVQAVLGSSHPTVRSVKAFVVRLKRWQADNQRYLKEPD